MKRQLLMGIMQGLGIMLAIIIVFAVAVAIDILTIDKDGTIRLRVSDQGKVTLNTSDAAQGDLRFTPRSSDPTAPLAGDLWYNDTVKEVKYSDGGMTKPLAEMTNADISLYVDGTNGNDNNNGLTSGTAKKTIQAAVNLIPPIVRHIVTVNIATGLYRDTGATVNGEDVCVYIANRTVTSGGVINLVGNETTPANVHVDGSNDGTTPTRYMGFYVNRVATVNVKGVQCDYFKKDGIQYYMATGSPTNGIFSNNLRSGIFYNGYSTGSASSCTCNGNGVGAGYLWPQAGIYYNAYSQGSPSSCTTNNNGARGIMYYSLSAGSPASCTANNNASFGINYSEGCRGTPSSCVITGNGSYGISIVGRSTVSPNGCTIDSNGGHGIVYSGNSGGNPGATTANTGSNNTGYGIYGNTGSIVDYSGAGPTGTSGFTYEDAATYAKVY